MGFLMGRHGVPEELRLREVFAELLGEETLLDGHDLLRVVDVCTLGRGGRLDDGVPVGPVVCLAGLDAVLHGAVAVEVHDWADGAVDGELLPVDAQSAQLSVEVTEVTGLEEWVIGEADSGNDVSGTEGCLLDLGEVLFGVLVQLDLTDVADGEKFLGPNLCGIEDVEVEVVGLLLFASLNSELPGGEHTVPDGIGKITSVEVRVLTGDLEGFVPD